MPVKYPIAYARLLDRALADPIPEWKDAIEAHVRGMADSLSTLGEEVLRKAYVAGLADGFAQGVAAESDSQGLSLAREALDKIGAYTGGDIMEIVTIASDTIRELDRVGPVNA